MIPDLNAIILAADRIRKYIHQTPILTNSTLNEILQAEVYFKCENFQKAGAFKSRGACNAVFSLSEENAAKGVATHSSGNHAQALARAASLRNIPSYIVMPENAPQVKVDAVRKYGGEIHFCKPNLHARELTLEAVIDKTAAVEIHPYNDYKIIAGQATAAMEILEEKLQLDFIMAPVGGGGLLSGTALSVSYLSAHTETLAAEPVMADDAYRSFKSGKLIPSGDPKTIADGLLTSLGDKTFPIIKDNVKDILLASENAIYESMLLIFERMKIVVEPSAAVPLAAVLENKNLFKGKSICLILSGGNIDLRKFNWPSIQ